jgi:hypothetical protein
MFFYLQKSKLQLVSADTFAALARTMRALQFVFLDYKLGATLQASLASRATLDFQLKVLELG